MSRKKLKKQRNETIGNIEDLTLNETEAGAVKGGATDFLLVIDGIKGESRDDRSSAIRAGYDFKLQKKV